MSSRILSRNGRGFECEVGECVSRNIPQPSDPRRPEWEWPSKVNNPLKYAYYISRLHEQSGLSLSFPLGAYQRFASTYWMLGPEVLCRAAYLAALRARHPFSPKFIKKCLDEVPHPPRQIIMF